MEGINAMGAQVAAALHFLCTELPTRTLGTEGNRQATRFVEAQLAASGWHSERQPFDCLEWIDSGAWLTAHDVPGEDSGKEPGKDQWSILPGPWSLPCVLDAPLVDCTTVEEIEAQADLSDTILLLHGPIAEEQLMPKDYPFYYPEAHQRIYTAIESCKPAAVLAATGRNPSLAGGIYPFPLIEDGNFGIPTAYMTDVEGARLLAAAPAAVHLEIRSERRQAQGWNVVARKGSDFAHPIILCAHIDAKSGTPGAIDNAAGVVTLLQTAVLLADYDARQGVEIVIFNGEDNYAAAGELEYLRRMGPRVSDPHLVLNVDGAGKRGSANAWSLYNCPPPTDAALRATLEGRDGLVEGEPWYQSDHAIFVQAGVPALAFTTADFANVWAHIAHTAADTPELVDCDALVSLAHAIRAVITALA